MKQHKVKLAKGHQLIDAISQCVDFIEGEYGFRPTVLKHNNVDLIREVAFGALDKSTLKTYSHYAVQNIYGMRVTRSTKLKSDVVVLVLIDRSNGQPVEVVTITV